MGCSGLGSTHQLSACSCVRHLHQFRVISLLSVEGKILFSIGACRLSDFFHKNGYIDTLIQKGDQEVTKLCSHSAPEHLGVVVIWCLVVLWLSLANAKFHVSESPVPAISEHPVKSLEKFFNSSLRDTETIKNTSKEWLQDVNKMGLPGKFKIWICRQGIKQIFCMLSSCIVC